MEYIHTLFKVPYNCCHCVILVFVYVLLSYCCHRVILLSVSVLMSFGGVSYKNFCHHVILVFVSVLVSFVS